jgi:hypothetical protein
VSVGALVGELVGAADGASDGAADGGRVALLVAEINEAPVGSATFPFSRSVIIFVPIASPSTSACEITSLIADLQVTLRRAPSFSWKISTVYWTYAISTPPAWAIFWTKSAISSRDGEEEYAMMTSTVTSWVTPAVG